MTEAQAHEAIVKRFVTQWATLYPSMPVRLANETADSADEWIWLAIVPATSRQSAVGGLKRWVREGTIGVKIYTLAASGTQRASQLADAARTVLEGQFLTVTGESEPVVTYGGASGTPLSDGKWFIQTVTFGYRFDHLRA